MAIPIYLGVKLYGRIHGSDGTAVATQCFHLGEDGSWQDCVYAGYYRYEGKDVPKDLPLAVKYFDRACEHDKPYGCRGLGLADHARAPVAWEKACRLGEKDSCVKLAALHDPGDGVTKDRAGEAATQARLLARRNERVPLKSV